jgi:hypothetical protein
MLQLHLQDLIGHLTDVLAGRRIDAGNLRVESMVAHGPPHELRRVAATDLHQAAGSILCHDSVCQPGVAGRKVAVVPVGADFVHLVFRNRIELGGEDERRHLGRMTPDDVGMPLEDGLDVREEVIEGIRTNGDAKRRHHDDAEGLFEPRHHAFQLVERGQSRFLYHGRPSQTPVLRSQMLPPGFCRHRGI